MSVYEDIVKSMAKNPTLAGLAIGVGVAILAPAVIATVGRMLQPAAKTAVKGGVALYDKGKEMAAGTAEAARGLSAEARAELAKEREAEAG